MLEKEINIHMSPFIQIGLILFVMLIWIGGGIGLSRLGILTENPHFPWLVSASMLLFFAIFNCAFSLNAPDVNRYWMHSIMSYVVLVIVAGGLAYLITGISIYEARSMKWMYFVFTFGYLVFLSIVNFMRIIVKLAQREDNSLRGDR